MTIVAVINDHTNQFIYVLEEYKHNFPLATFVAKEIVQGGQFGEDAVVLFDGFKHFVSGSHYSFIRRGDNK